MSTETPVGRAHLCFKGHEFMAVRREGSRVAPMCPVCAENGSLSTGRLIDSSSNEIYGKPNISIPSKFHVGWYDVHDRSPKELAKDPTIERYAPSQVRTGQTNQGGMSRLED
jgi:hypothetical protein